MAALTSPHWEAVTAGARTLLVTLDKLPPLKPFYLAGGTATALRLGHRLSEDLDLFANVDFDRADEMSPPFLFLPVEWETIKAFFVSEAVRLGQLWFGSASAP